MRYLITLLMIMVRIHLLPDWMNDRTPDSTHFYRRTFTRRHRAKRSLVKNVWIAAGLLMLFNPILSFVLIVALPTTLLSFAILDETS